MKAHLNARDGLRKIYIAEILVIASVFSSLFHNVLAVVFGLCAVCALVIRLLGIKKAALDNTDYQKAYSLVLFGLIANLVMLVVTVGSEGVDLGNIINTIENVVNVFSTYIIIDATCALLDFNGRVELSAYGKATKKMYVLGYALAVLASILMNMETLLGHTLTLIIGIVGLVLSILASIRYIIFLKRTYPVV